MTTPSDALDHLTGTFSADRRFFDELMATPSGERFLEMSVWFLWLQEYLHDLQESLMERGTTHGSTFQVWVTSMVAGTAQSLGMVMYLVSRGVVQEAAASARRALEYLGMLAHLLNDPSKARFLETSGVQSSDFEEAFVRGGNRSPSERQRLKKENIRYRFAAMDSGHGRMATRLYELFSQFNVHGGTMSSLTALAMMPTKTSCAFHNRSLEKTAQNLPILQPVIELVAMELAYLVGRHGVRTKRVNEAGACVLVWLDKTDPRWQARIDSLREQFGLPSGAPGMPLDGSSGSPPKSDLPN